MSKDSPSSEAVRHGGVREKAQQACESEGQVPGAGGVAADSAGPCWARLQSGDSTPMGMAGGGGLRRAAAWGG